MNKLIEQSELRDIYEKVAAGQRISDDDCLRLFRSRDLAAIGAMANRVRERKNGNVAYYILNRHVNYSNICILDCDFCAFYRRRRDAGAYEYNLPEMIDKAREALELGVTEIHIVGGLHPSFKWEYYIEMLRELKALDPHLHLKAFTAIEILHLSWVGKRSVPETLAALREAGLGSLTGGGAEIFDPEVRRVICHAKETAEEWLGVHRTWHKIGGRSTCTMLIGHVEQEHHRVDHLRRLRELQDETGGFTAFVTLAFHPENTKLAHLPGPSGFDLLRTLAIARIYLDNFDHIKAYWILMGMKLAQVSLSYGVDDIDGTIVEEKIYHMAGAKTPQRMAREELVRAIRETGREPVQRDSLYRVLTGEEERVGGETTATETAVSRVAATPLHAVAPPTIHQSPVTDHEFAGAGSEGGAA
ncbi:MAG TPA: aminofutalosine synthase MqnE [Verrucomicrobiae bacterium]|nr:aminofutalosine synthase MqnE [Verrucomicrobiae bacterium]